MKIRLQIIILILFFGTALFSQINLTAVIKDDVSQEVLAYCPFIIKGTHIGGISNEEGVFTISLRSENDTLIFSYVNYQTRIISANKILESQTVLLKRKESLLNEVVINSKSNFFYSVMEKCRNTILQTPEFNSKVYLEVETERENTPVNMVETYYNAKVKGSAIEELKIKNGRAGLARSKDFGYFVSDNASKAISRYSLTEKVQYMPENPLQYNASKLKKRYNLQLISETDQFYVVGFKPKKKPEAYFKGEVWIEKNTFDILKINLLCKNSEEFPFVPRSGGSIKNFSMYISQTYIKKKEHRVLNLIKFAYSHEFSNNRPSARINNGVENSLQFNTECTMYFFDYDKLFLLPYFKYNDSLSDYRKISFLPYNTSFWEKANGLVLTEKQNQKLEFFKKNGFLFNHSGQLEKKISEKSDGPSKKFFEDNYTIWNDTLRIKLKKKEKASDLGKPKSMQPVFRVEEIDLKAQLFLDINPVGDSLKHFSAAIFDVFETVYEIKEDENTECYINIFFDIYEIERRKMEKAIALFPNDINKIDQAYKQAMIEIESKTKTYLKEVQMGKNSSKFVKWNNYVKENLGIDNRKIFRLEDRK